MAVDRLEGVPPRAAYAHDTQEQGGDREDLAEAEAAAGPRRDQCETFACRAVLVSRPRPPKKDRAGTDAYAAAAAAAGGGNDSGAPASGAPASDAPAGPPASVLCSGSFTRRFAPRRSAQPWALVAGQDDDESDGDEGGGGGLLYFGPLAGPLVGPLVDPFKAPPPTGRSIVSSGPVSRPAQSRRALLASLQSRCRAPSCASARVRCAPLRVACVAALATVVVVVVVLPQQ